jgi:hypothetical protein
MPAFAYETWVERLNALAAAVQQLEPMATAMDVPLERELAKLLMKLCEKTGCRLRRAKYSAQGVHVSCVYTDLSWWHIGRKFDVPVYTALI